MPEKQNNAAPKNAEKGDGTGMKKPDISLAQARELLGIKPDIKVSKEQEAWIKNQALMLTEAHKNVDMASHVIDALAPKKEPSHETVAAKPENAESQKNTIDSWENVVARTRAMEQLGKNIEKVIGLFDGKNSQALRDTFCRTLNVPAVKNLKKLDLRTTYENLASANDVPDGLHSDAAFSKMLADLSKDIRPVLEEEGASWSDLEKGSELLSFNAEAQVQNTQENKADEETKSPEELAAENKRDALISLGGDLSKFRGLAQSPKFAKYNLGDAMKKILKDPYNITDADKAEMVAYLKNSDMKDADTYHDFIKDALTVAQEQNKDQPLNRDEFTSEVRPVVDEINAERAAKKERLTKEGTKKTDRPMGTI